MSAHATGTAPVKVGVSGLNKVFGLEGGTTLQALKDVSFEVSTGEFLCVLGRSGCGKSTLLRLLAGLDSPSSGSIRIVTDPDHPHQGSTMVFQEHLLFPWLTVLGNITFGLGGQKLTQPERKTKAMRYLDLVGLAEYAGHYPKELSIGMKQRVGIARALVVEPEVLLMDEPTASLDAQTKIQFQQDLLDIWTKTQRTIIYITHDVEEALYLADNILVMTPHPGQVKTLVQVGLKRPRDRSGTRFNRLKKECYRLLT